MKALRQNSVGVLVLAGGRSERLKENKALIRLGGKPLLLHVVERVLDLTNEIIVAVGKNDELSAYTRILPPTVIVVKDAVEGKGPLAGIFAGMKSMRSKYALVLSCDSPFIKKEVLMYLLHKVQKADAAIPQWSNGNIEPLHAGYKICSALTATETALEKSELFIRDMIKRLGKVIYVSTEEIRKLDPTLITFFNINSPEDLKAALLHQGTSQEKG